MVLLKTAFTSQDIPIQFETLTDGGALLLRLRQLAELPDSGVRLVLPDARLPRLSTDEVLASLAGQNLKVNVPIVVLSSFVSKKSRDRLEGLGVTAVVEKPIDWDGYVRLARRVQRCAAALRLLRLNFRKSSNPPQSWVE